ncbi:MAG: tetratricopeptide repeat protein [Propionibacteriaceae bacterium]|jgi:putative thioredoxin|nr:tetratricopeptide repeat protein [Propionibacteriaceae bacterium]
MTQPANARGVIDLAALGAVASQSGGFVVEVDEASFEATARQSMRFPIVIELYSPRGQGQAQLSQTLTELANAAGGSWLLARIDVDASPKIAAGLGVQAVPTVLGLLAGQLVPLWQGTLDKAEAARYIEELLKLAAANGLLGKAEAVAPAGEPEPDLEAKYEPAYAALEAGRFEEAQAGFEALLQETPADPVARAGKAQAGLYARLAELDPAAAAQAEAAVGDPTAVEAVLILADQAVASGDPAAGFARLTEAIAGAAGPERERLRLRLLELFDTLASSDPIVLRARRDLATALF